MRAAPLAGPRWWLVRASSHTCVRVRAQLGVCVDGCSRVCVGLKIWKATCASAACKAHGAGAAGGKSKRSAVRLFAPAPADRIISPFFGKGIHVAESPVDRRTTSRRRRYSPQRNVARGELAARLVSLRPIRDGVRGASFSFAVSFFHFFYICLKAFFLRFQFLSLNYRG